MTEIASHPEPDARVGAPHPRETEHLYGQEAAEAAFLQSVRDGRIHHAWLITGPEGVGKATLAWRIARFMLNGATGDNLQIARNAPIFERLLTLTHPGLFLCRRGWDEKANRLRTTISIDDIRALKSFFQVRAEPGQWRVAIVDAMDDVGAPAANALLKILEEPPARALIILISHNPASLLPTIRSRCRVLQCTPLAAPDLNAALAASDGAKDPSAEQSAMLATLSAGSVGRAQALLEEGGIDTYDRLLDMFAAAPMLDRPTLFELSQGLSARDARPSARLVLDLIELVIRRMALAAAGGEVAALSARESAIWDRLAASPAQAAIWADAAASLRKRAEASLRVNLDAAQVMLDTFLQLETPTRNACRVHQ